MSKENSEQQFTAPSPAALKLSNIRGLVEIRTGEDGVISITSVKHEHTGDADKTIIEISQDAGGMVSAITRFPEGGWNWLFGSQPCRVDYIVKAPRHCSLKVNGVSNSVLVEGFEGEFSIESVSGEMTLRDLNGSARLHTVSGGMILAGLSGALRLNTVSGGISGERISGSLHVDTVSGTLRLTESSLTSVEAGTVSGNLQLQIPLAAGPYRFGSVSGEVRLKVPADTRCSAELHSISGRIVTDLPQTSASRHNGTQVVEMQGGGVQVYMNSVSGGLSLEIQS